MFWLIEFVIHYRSLCGDLEISLLSMKTNISNIKRALMSEWYHDLKILSGSIFADPKEGLVAVIEKVFLNQNMRKKNVRSYNILTISHIKKLYASKSFTRETPVGFVTRVVLHLELIETMRQPTLVILTISQLHKTEVDGELARMIKGVMESQSDGAYKIERVRTAEVGKNR